MPHRYPLQEVINRGTEQAREQHDKRVDSGEDSRTRLPEAIFLIILIFHVSLAESTTFALSARVSIYARAVKVFSFLDALSTFFLLYSSKSFQLRRKYLARRRKSAKEITVLRPPGDTHASLLQALNLTIKLFRTTEASPIVLIKSLYSKVLYTDINLYYTKNNLCSADGLLEHLAFRGGARVHPDGRWRDRERGDQLLVQEALGVQAAQRFPATSAPVHRAVLLRTRFFIVIF